MSPKSVTVPSNSKKRMSWRCELDEQRRRSRCAPRRTGCGSVGVWPLATGRAARGCGRLSSRLRRGTPPTAVVSCRRRQPSSVAAVDRRRRGIRSPTRRCRTRRQGGSRVGIGDLGNNSLTHNQVLVSRSVLSSGAANGLRLVDSGHIS